MSSEQQVHDDADIEAVARARIRTLRQSLNWSLDQLAERSHLSPSTISRIETGKRGIGLDVLVAIARALQVDVNELIEVRPEDDDVVIRSQPVLGWHGATVWPLSRPTGTVTALRVRLEPGVDTPQSRVHPGHDWFYVMSGRITLVLGSRRIVVEEGEAAEFSTMTPHAMIAIDDPAELIMVFDREGRRTHLHDGGRD